MQDDAELCCLAQRGDLTAASTLVDRHYTRIYAYLRRRLVEPVTQSP